jgi:monoamine oxidase
MRKIERREFVKLAGLTTAAAATSFLFPGTIRGRTGATPRVIVVGGGLAGLTAAFELQQSDFDVTLLEAQLRAGGRVHTLREPFSDGLYAEAGAISLSDVDTATLDYVKRFALPLGPTNPSKAPPRFRVRGSWLTDPMRSPYRLSESESKAGLRAMYDHYRKRGILSATTAAAASVGSPAARELDRLSVRELLRRNGASSEAIDFLRLTALGFSGEGLDTSSALSTFLAESHYAQSNASFVIEGGNDRLPAAFARELAERIRYGFEVREITQYGDRVRVSGMSNGETQSLDAEHVVLAVPLTILKTIECQPAWSTAKQRAMSEIVYSSVSRVYLQARQRVWQKSHPTARVITDAPRSIIEDHTMNQPGPRGIVESHTFGPEARVVAKLSERQRLDEATRLLEGLFSGIGREIEGGISKCWDEDPWARGAYIDYRVGQMSAYLQELARPEGRLHFAGEHTSTRFASMEGALQSGRRAAEEVRLRRR